MTSEQSWTNPFTAEFERRKAEVLAMPGFEFKVDLEALGRAGHVLVKNADDLVRHASAFLRGRRYVPNISDEYENELVRFLHNYLTAVYSLIEAQRVVMRHRWGDQSEFETGVYSEWRRAVFETGEAEFMTELRNYCTHRSIPVPGMVTTLFGQAGQSPQIRNELKLDRDKLLEWKKWTAPAKAYLRAKDQEFDLLPVIQSYISGVREFFDWFVQEIQDRNADIKDEYTTAAQELKDWYVTETGITDEFISGGRPPSLSKGQGQRQQPKRQIKRRRRRGK
jgi:hypothetical protein